MLAIAYLLEIDIGLNPSLTKFGPFELTWHGIFTAVGIAAGVYLAAWLGRRQGITEDDAYTIALIAVPAGIIGARSMWVLENHRQIGEWTDVFRINEGGITVLGAAIGGILAACIYGGLRRMPVMRGLDVAGIALLLGMAIGRIGDLINGEHIAKTTSLWWGVAYTHINSPGYSVLGTGEKVYRHPATTYEMIGDLLVIGVMLLLFAKFWRTRPGITFFSGVILYSAMRFGVSYLRIDSCGGRPISDADCPEYIIQNWMTFPQVVSTITFTIGVVGLAWSIMRKPQEEPLPAPPPGAPVKRTATA